MKAHFARTPTGFIPVEEDAEKILKKIGMGEIVELDYKHARNYGFHKKFFAMVQHVFENQETYATMQQVLDIIKIGAGHYDLLILPNGERNYVPRSISFDNMEELEFQEFYDKAVAAVVRAKLATDETINYIATNF